MGLYCRANGTSQEPEPSIFHSTPSSKKTIKDIKMAGFFNSAAEYLMGSVSAAADMARGWGKGIKWVSFREGQKQAKEQGNPAMVVIHKTWCRACKALKPRFANSRDIGQLSNQFVMINVEDDEEPKTSEYKPDGGYIPRILFLDNNGNVMNEVTNESQTQWKYFYGETASIAESMKKVIKRTGGGSSSSDIRINKMNRSLRRNNF